MGNFIDEKSFVRFFNPDDDFGISSFGYDNFLYVTAAHSFRVQNFYTWHFVISGKGHLEIGGKAYELSEGDCFFIPPDTPMRYFPAPQDPWEYAWFSMRGNAAARYGEQLSFSIESPIRPCKHFARAKQILKRTLEDMRTEEHGYYRVVSAFYELMDISTSKRSSKIPIEEVREFIDANCMVPDFSIENLCRDVGFSHAHLLRLFKAAYGKTVKHYVIEKRLAFACELLENSNISVSSVALSCGFSDELHFMKSFKRQYGMTASEYRKGARW